jgi:hypothetical protein
VRHHQDDAGRRYRLGDIKHDYTTLGDCTEHQRGVTQALRRELCSKAGLTLNLEGSVDARRRLANMAVPMTDYRIGLSARNQSVRRKLRRFLHQPLRRALHSLLCALDDTH